MVAQDDDCEILTVGAWYGMTGYGVGFRRGSKHLVEFNEKLMQYKDNGKSVRRLRAVAVWVGCWHENVLDLCALSSYLAH